MHNGQFIEERIVLEDSKPANFGRLWDNGEGSSLEGPNEGFDVDSG